MAAKIVRSVAGLILLFAVLGLFLVDPVREICLHRSHLFAEGFVTGSQLGGHQIGSDGDVDMYLAVSYQFEAGGKYYTGSYETAEDDDPKHGSVVEVEYSPSDPSLNRRVSSELENAVGADWFVVWLVSAVGIYGLACASLDVFRGCRTDRRKKLLL